ncbi:MAG: hypothetical protein ACHBN1_09095, partial [Heteroscytonema crispum UTEX LB 1556]
KSTLAHYLMQSFISLLVAKPNLPLLMARFMVHNLAQIMIQVIISYHPQHQPKAAQKALQCLPLHRSRYL